MESIVAYVVLFIAGLTVLYAYQWRKTRKQNFVLSRQSFSDAELELIIQKQHGKNRNIIIQLKAKTDLQIDEVFVELIRKNREFEVLKFRTGTDQTTDKIFVGKNNQHHFHIDHDFFKKMISEQDKEFKTFRMVIANHLGKKYKTHELAFNSKWSLFRPDSGKYN